MSLQRDVVKLPGVRDGATPCRCSALPSVRLSLRLNITRTCNAVLSGSIHISQSRPALLRRAAISPCDGTRDECGRHLLPAGWMPVPDPAEGRGRARSEECSSCAFLDSWTDSAGYCPRSEADLSASCSSLIPRPNRRDTKERSSRWTTITADRARAKPPAQTPHHRTSTVGSSPRQ